MTHIDISLPPAMPPATDGDDDEWATDGQDAEGEAAAGAGQTKRGRAKGKAKAGAEKKTRTDLALSNSDCFVSGCQDKAKRNCRACVDHERVVAAMKYQAKAAGEVQALDEVLAHPTKGATAVKEFAANNVIAGKFRHKKIEWTDFKKSYEVSVSFTERSGQELMDQDEHCAYWTTRGKSQAWADSDWQGLVQARVDGEGEGAARIGLFLFVSIVAPSPLH